MGTASRNTAEDLAAALVEARALVRELHELIKDGNTLKRDLRDARQAIGNDATDACNRVIADRVGQITATIDACAENINKSIAASHENIRQRTAELAGLNTPEEFMEKIAAGIKVVVLQAVSEQLVELDDLVRQQSQPPKQSRPQRRQKRR